MAVDQEMTGRVREWAEAAAAGLELEIFACRIKPYAGGAAVEVLADHASGGMTMDECGALNKELVRIFEDQNFMTGNYILNVSSPGMDWPLHEPRDYRRVVGHRLDVTYLTENETVKSVSGNLTAVHEDAIVLAAREQEHVINFKYIQKAVQTI
ncbi:MAG: ribosome maturation factor RimP [Candidatus Omnitrophota bacterium]